MKRLLIFVLAQTLFTPTTVPREVASSPGSSMMLIQGSALPVVIVVPGIVATENAAKGQAAFDGCMKTGNAPACEGLRRSAIRADVDERFKLAFAGLYALVPDKEKEEILTEQGLYRIKE